MRNVHGLSVYLLIKLVHFHHHDFQNMLDIKGVGYQMRTFSAL